VKKNPTSFDDELNIHRIINIYIYVSLSILDNQSFNLKKNIIFYNKKKKKKNNNKHKIKQINYLL